MIDAATTAEAIHRRSFFFKHLRAVTPKAREAARTTEIPIVRTRYEEITSGALSFLLLKKDGYKVGEELSLPEYADGKATGRTLEIKVSYIWEDWTGLDDDYCILGFQLMSYTPLAAAGEYADQPTLQPRA